MPKLVPVTHRELARKLRRAGYLAIMTLQTIQQMSRTEKLQAMELLWLSLSKEDDKLDSPAWHGDALRETQQRYEAGQEKSVDWDAAKKELRKRFE